MTVNIGNLYRKRTVRNLAGQIVDLTDETNGGVIIQKGNVVNQERYEELQRIEADRKKAAEAIQHQIVASPQVEEQRATSPTKLQEIEKRQDATDAKLDAILALLQKPKKSK